MLEDARISLYASQAVFSATQTAKTQLLTQSAAIMVERSATQYKTGYQPVDEILDGGLKRGFVLELSGAPGTCKEDIALGMIKSFVENDQGALLIGLQLNVGLNVHSRNRSNLIV